MVLERDWIFQKVFVKLFVYNILFEDSEVDETFLGVNESSTVLGISGAGCGIANHLSRHPRGLDAVDINPHHLALTALKATAAQRLHSYEEFYQLLGVGKVAHSRKVLKALMEGLPGWIQDYWSRHFPRFQRNLYHTGLTASMIGLVRNFSGLNAEWVKAMARETLPQRQKRMEKDVIATFDYMPTRMVLRSPLQLVAIGVNFHQRDKLTATTGLDLFAFFVQYLKNLCATDVERNWFLWWACAGRFNHDCQDALPPYLRRDHHQHSIESPTLVRYHHTNIFQVLGQAGKDTWSHFTLCDAPDWMPEPVQKRLFSEIVRTGRDGGVVLHRSVERVPLIERLGLEKHLRLMEEESRQATQTDRTRMYERTWFYRIEK